MDDGNVAAQRHDDNAVRRSDHHTPQWPLWYPGTTFELVIDAVRWQAGPSYSTTASLISRCDIWTDHRYCHVTGRSVVLVWTSEELIERRTCLWRSGSRPECSSYDALVHDQNVHRLQKNTQMLFNIVYIILIILYCFIYCFLGLWLATTNMGFATMTSSKNISVLAAILLYLSLACYFRLSVVVAIILGHCFNSSWSKTPRLPLEFRLRLS